MNFNVGDRVIVTGGTQSKYFGTTGTVEKVRESHFSVLPDKEWGDKFNSHGPWTFYRDLWTIEFLDNSDEAIPEDWS